METERTIQEQVARTIQPIQGNGGTAQFMDNRRKPLQAKSVDTIQCEGLEDEEAIQGKFAAQRKPNHTGLPDNLKAGIEDMSGLSMDDVRVHYNSSQPAAVQAHAYTQGADIHVAPGQEQHLPHEAWHVVQQMQGRVEPTTEVGGLPVNDNFDLEHEADLMGSRAVM